MLSASHLQKYRNDDREYDRTVRPLTLHLSGSFLHERIDRPPQFGSTSRLTVSRPFQNPDWPSPLKQSYFRVTVAVVATFCPKSKEYNHHQLRDLDHRRRSLGQHLHQRRNLNPLDFPARRLVGGRDGLSHS